MEIRSAKTDSEIFSCFPILKQLRPEITERTFVTDAKEKMQAGLKLVFLYNDGVRAIACYRLIETFRGKILYVDDLVTDSGHRSKGCGKFMLDWLLSESKQLGCKYLELDSGLKRLDAHRFYRRQGLEEIGFHFSVPTDGGQKWTSD